MREPSSAPPEFVSYVDRRLRVLESAALRLTGDDLQSERLARELMTLVALRWPRLSRSDSRHELASGESADAYLVKLLHQEASEYGYPRMVVNLDATLPNRRRSTLGGVMPAQEEADFLWEVARRKVRRRLLIATAAGGVVTVAALCHRGGSRDDDPEEPLRQPPLVQSTELPQGALILRDRGLGLHQILGVPVELTLPAKPALLSQSPIPRAVLLAGSSNQYGGVFALADDGSWREIDAAPFPAATWISATSLSPDGRRAVFVTPTVGVLVDLVTGQAQELPGSVAGTKPVWLREQQLLVSKGNLLDLATGKLDSAPVGPEDVVTPRDDGGDRSWVLTELLSIGRPITAPARVRRWRMGQRESAAVIIPLMGSVAGVVGSWQGPGFGFGPDRVARICQPRNLPGSLSVDVIVAVLDPNSGEVFKALLIDTSVSGSPALIGWQDMRTVLLTLARESTQQLVAWDVLADEVSWASKMGFVGAITMRDLNQA